MGLACAIPHLSWRCNLTLSLKNDVIWILLVMTWTWLHTCAWSLSIITTSQGESDACPVLHALTHSLLCPISDKNFCFDSWSSKRIHNTWFCQIARLRYTFKIFLKVKIICLCGFVFVRKTNLSCPVWKSKYLRS